jgi:hypothetical protein
MTKCLDDIGGPELLRDASTPIQADEAERQLGIWEARAR